MALSVECERACATRGSLPGYEVHAFTPLLLSLGAPSNRGRKPGVAQTVGHKNVVLTNFESVASNRNFRPSSLEQPTLASGKSPELELSATQVWFLC